MSLNYHDDVEYLSDLKLEVVSLLLVKHQSNSIEDSIMNLWTW